MKKAVKEKKVCVHADTYGACAKKGFMYKGLRCDPPKCKDFEEKAEAVANAGHSTSDAQRSAGKAVPPDALKWQTCGHADADGRCANPEGNGQGGMCNGCEDYRDRRANAQRSTPNAQLSTEGEGHERDHGVQEAGGGVPGGGGGGAVADARGVAPERGRELERGVRDAGQEAEAGEKGDGAAAGGGVGVGGRGVRPGDAAGEADREPVGAGAVVRGARGGVPLGGRGGEDVRLKAEVGDQRPEVRGPSQACAYAREEGELPDVTVEEIVSGYLNAVSGVLAVVRFGAMMLVKESVLKLKNGAKADDPGYDGGLRAWLAGNVTDVNYKTAMGFKGTAYKVCEVLGVSAGVLLRSLNPDPKALPDEPDCDALISCRDRLLDIVAGKNSVNALVLWLKGRTPDLLPEGKEAEDTGKADEIALDAARKFARSVCDALEGMDARRKTSLRKALAKDLRERFGAKRLVFLAQVIEEACGE